MLNDLSEIVVLVALARGFAEKLFVLAFGAFVVVSVGRRFFFLRNIGPFGGELGVQLKPLFEADDSGISFKGKRYNWGDISHVEKYEPSYLWNLIAYGVGFTKGYIDFNDGKRIRIDARVFSKKDLNDSSGKKLFSEFWSQLLANMASNHSLKGTN